MTQPTAAPSAPNARVSAENLEKDRTLCLNALRDILAAHPDPANAEAVLRFLGLHQYNFRWLARSVYGNADFAFSHEAAVSQLRASLTLRVLALGANAPRTKEVTAVWRELIFPTASFDTTRTIYLRSAGELALAQGMLLLSPEVMKKICWVRLTKEAYEELTSSPGKYLMLVRLIRTLSSTSNHRLRPRRAREAKVGMLFRLLNEKTISRRIAQELDFWLKFGRLHGYAKDIEAIGDTTEREAALCELATDLALLWTGACAYEAGLDRHPTTGEAASKHPLEVVAETDLAICRHEGKVHSGAYLNESPAALREKKNGKSVFIPLTKYDLQVSGPAADSAAFDLIYGPWHTLPFCGLGLRKTLGNDRFERIARKLVERDRVMFEERKQAALVRRKPAVPMKSVRMLLRHFNRSFAEDQAILDELEGMTDEKPLKGKPLSDDQLQELLQGEWLQLFAKQKIRPAELVVPRDGRLVLPRNEGDEDNEADVGKARLASDGSDGSHGSNASAGTSSWFGAGGSNAASIETDFAAASAASETFNPQKASFHSKSMLLGLLVPLCFLTGCTSLSGLDAESDFSCPRDPGVSCATMNDTFRMSREGTLPWQQAEAQADAETAETADNIVAKVVDAPVSGTTNVRRKGYAVVNDAAAPVRAVRADAVVEPSSDPEGFVPGEALTRGAYDDPATLAGLSGLAAFASPERRPERIVRLWFAPRTDNEGDLHDGHFVYILIEPAGWRTADRRKPVGAALVALPFARAKTGEARSRTGSGISPFGTTEPRTGAGAERIRRDRERALRETEAARSDARSKKESGR